MNFLTSLLYYCKTSAENTYSMEDRYKTVIDNILFADTTYCDKQLLRHMEEETQFRTRKIKPIGFSINEKFSI